ncbi:hypothetical protein ABPG72_013310 [Tetrahymena utriculariae]
MDTQKCKRNIQLQPISLQHQFNNRALSAFFLEVERDQFYSQQNSQQSCKLGKSQEQTSNYKDQQQMFTDLYQRIQIRKHLNAWPKQQENSPQTFSKEIFVQQNPNQLVKSQNSSLSDLDQHVSQFSEGLMSQRIGLHQINSNLSEQGNSILGEKKRKGHLWSGIKVLQAQIKNNKLRSLSENYQNQRLSQDQIFSKSKKPKLKLQIKSLSFQQKIESNRLKLLSYSSQNKSNFFLNQSTEEMKNSQANLLNQQKNSIAFNVFYENDDFMSSKYNQAFKRQNLVKQQEMIQNSSSIKSNQFSSNNLSTPAKRSRATTQESSTQNTPINTNQNTNPILIKQDLQYQNQISIFQTSPEILSITPLKNPSLTQIDINFNGDIIDNVQNQSYSLLNNLAVTQNSYNFNQTPEEYKCKKKIILKVKKESNKFSPIMDPQIQIHNHNNQDISKLSFSNSPVKSKNIQIQKLSSSRKVILFSKKQSTQNLNTSEKEQDNNNDGNFVSNEMLSSTTKYLECRKMFTFSKALMSRDPQKFQSDCLQSQNNK